VSNTINTQPTRPVEELRNTPYLEMNSAEINKLRQEDPAAFTAAETAFNAQFAPPPPVEGEIAAPAIPPTRRIYRNGVEVETNTAVRFVNGIPVVQQ
jgi:hypothetical protein